MDKKYRDMIIQNIKDIGKSLIDNAERIVADYEYPSDKQLGITIYDIETSPHIRIDSEFYPEGFINRYN